MDWQYWLATRLPDYGDDVLECTPVEFNDDGTINVVLGLAFVTSLDDLKSRGAKKVWEVDDVHEVANPRLLWESDA